jgi:hypothetical protein
VELVIAQDLELCANSHWSVSAPASLSRFTRLHIAAATYDLGEYAPWNIDEDGAGELPAGTEIHLEGYAEFPNVTGDQQFPLTSGRWAAIEDRDIRAQTAPGLSWLSPVSFPRMTDAPLSAATLRLETATPAANGTIRLELPRTSEDLTNFWAVVSCANAEVDECALGNERYPVGIGIELVPCDGAGAARELRVDTARGSFTFGVESMPRQGESSFGIGLLRSARGTYQAAEFEQHELRKLSMASGGPSLPGFGEEFAVLFDDAIGETCGVLVANLDFEPQQPLDPLGRIAYEITCDLERGAAFEVLSFAWNPPL